MMRKKRSNVQMSNAVPSPGEGRNGMGVNMGASPLRNKRPNYMAMKDGAITGSKMRKKK